MLKKPTICLAVSVLMFSWPLVAQSEQLSAHDQLSIGSTRSAETTPGLWGAISLSPSQSSEQALGRDSFRQSNDQPTDGVLGLGNNFGVIFDYTDDLPRVRGLAYSPNDRMRVEARGRFDADLSDVGARVLVHFNF